MNTISNSAVGHKSNPTEVTSSFFKAIFGNAEGFICIWTLPDKASRFFENGDQGRAEAAEYAIAQGRTNQVYFGTGLLKERPRKGRGTAADVIAIGALCLDVDFGPGHKKPCPPSEAAAHAILRRVGVLPSIIVHSGGGLHAYYLMPEPLILPNPDARRRAAEFAKQWQERVRQEFEADGYSIDSTFDVSRVLRVPGTFHRKDSSNPKPVTIQHPTGELNGQLVRYPRERFEAIIRNAKAGPMPNRTSRPAPEPAPAADRPADKAATPAPAKLQVVPKADAQPDAGLLTALLANNKKFEAAWNRTAKSVKDTTPSGWDMALAAYAAQADWPPQEICNLLVASRRKHGDDLKLDNPQYYERTINKALSGGDPRRDPRIETREGKIIVINEELTRTLDYIGPPVVDIKRFGEDESVVDLELASGAIVAAGTVRDLMRPDRFQEALLQAAGSTIKSRIKRDDWKRLAELIWQAATVIDTGGRTDQVAEWLVSATSTFGPPIDRQDPKELVCALREVKEGGTWTAAGYFDRDHHLYIRLAKLIGHVAVAFHMQAGSKELRVQLARLGFERVLEQARDGQDHVQARMWRSKKPWTDSLPPDEHQIDGPAADAEGTR